MENIYKLTNLKYHYLVTWIRMTVNVDLDDSHVDLQGVTWIRTTP